MIQWYRINLPEIVIGNDANSDQKLTVSEDLDQEYKFESTASMQAQQQSQSALGSNLDQGHPSSYHEPIAYMHYTRSFKKLIMGT